MAAHGLAYLVTLNHQGKLTRLLMDAANAPLPLFNNLEALEHSVDEIDAVVISHGHPDHYGGLFEFLAKRTGGPIPVYLHKDVFLPKLSIPPGRIGPWVLDLDQLMTAGVVLQENLGPQLVLDQALITGTVEATTAYEKPLASFRRKVSGQEEQDLFPDEQALVAVVEGRGLVVIGGCRPPGHRQHGEIRPGDQGVQKVSLIMGGFHLTPGGDTREGTTGVAKGAILTHRNLVANVQQVAAWIARDLQEGKETAIIPLPLYHVYALTSNLVFMKIGAHIILITNPRDMPRLRQGAGKVRVHAMVGVNTLYNALLNAPGFAAVGTAHAQDGRTRAAWPCSARWPSGGRRSPACRS